jgi:heterodisulfide reductase subunit A-like polyferredoxin
VGTRKAVFLPNFYSSPRFYVIDENTCLWYKDKSCRACEEVCPVDAIRFDADQKDTETEVTVDAVVIATGARQRTLQDFKEFGGGKLPRVLSLQQANRLLDPGGPTLGELRIPPSGNVADVKQLLVGNYHSLEARKGATTPLGERPSTVAFVQVRKDATAWAENGRVTLRWALDAIKAAALDNPALKVTLIHDKEAASTMKGQLIGLNKQLGVTLIEAEAVGARSDGKKAHVTYKAADGEKTLEADLVVVATPVSISEEVKALAAQLGLKLDEGGFLLPEGRVQVAGPARSPMEIEEVFDDASNAVGRLLVTLARS